MAARIAFIILLCLASLGAQSRSRTDTTLLNRVFTYKQRMDSVSSSADVNVYTRFYMNTDRRNPLLLAVPSMYRIGRGRTRAFAGETWGILRREKNERKLDLQVNVGTLPRHRQALTNVHEFLRPRLYDVMLITYGILSPFHKLNSVYYDYEVTRMSMGSVDLAFRPRVYNTRLVSGSATIDPTTGRVESVTFFGEFDMIRFSLSATMGEEGVRSLYPKRCDMLLMFKFLGNRFEADYYSEYAVEPTLPDSLDDCHDRAVMDTLRPEPLPERVSELYAAKDSIDSVAAANPDTMPEKRPNVWKRILWDNFADHLLNRTRVRIGDDEGYVRLDPLFNPLYFGYSKRKGLTYKIKVRMVYELGEESELSARFKGGYSFKQRQFYFNVPMRWTFDKSRHGFFEVLVGNGNRITNSSVKDRLRNVSKDSIEWDKLDLEYFKDFHVRYTVNYDFSKYFSAQLGSVFHRRSPVDKQSFRIVNGKMDYRSFAPFVELQWRPRGWSGPAFTIDYERGIPGVCKSDMTYERVEADMVWKKYLNPLRCLSLRCGAGVFTNRDKGAYFLDYYYFNSEHILGGWNDDWSGDFQLLDDHYYNSSRYYVRYNITYETPLLVLYKLPWVGRFIESERIYVNSLYSTQVRPYVEYGYGFTNRVFSMGAFMASRGAKFDGFGFRFGFELFSRW